MIAKAFMLASAGIVFTLGVIHFVYTFWGTKLTPRDPALQAAMGQVSMVITRETTMWKAWVGFNASHSMGAILFGLVYGYLAFGHADLLFESPVLLLVGFAMLGGFAILGKIYWFSVPFRAVCVALVLYVCSALIAHLG